tara:strand:- start:548 stop:871 length:324 start_codon:yes stop_codon:yes gene_type:complete
MQHHVIRIVEYARIRRHAKEELLVNGQQPMPANLAQVGGPVIVVPWIVLNVYREDLLNQPDRKNVNYAMNLLFNQNRELQYVTHVDGFNVATVQEPNVWKPENQRVI